MNAIRTVKIPGKYYAAFMNTGELIIMDTDPLRVQEKLGHGDIFVEYALNDEKMVKEVRVERKVMFYE